MSAHVVIIGGGITGLAALETLSRVAPDARVTLLEASARLGGHIRTEHTGGYVMEAGPDVVLTAKPAALELAKRVGLGDRIISTNPAAKGSYILRHGRLRRIPDGLSGLVPSRLGPFVTSPLVSLTGKMRVAMDYFIPPRRDDADESIEHFVVRRLGREMYDNLVEPLLSGISAGDGAALSIDAMFPRFRELELQHGGLIRGVLAGRRQGKAKSKATSTSAGGTGFASFPLGLQELVDATERTVRARDPHSERLSIRLRTRVERLTHAACDQPLVRGKYVVVLSAGESIVADAIILAAPAHAAADIVRELDPELSRQLGAVTYAPTATISVAYPNVAVGRVLDATGYVVPRIEKRAVLAATWVSSKFTDRAPRDHALFRLFLGGIGRENIDERSDDELVELARAEMREIMHVTAAPTLVRVNRFDRAMPQYTIGHRARMSAAIAMAARQPGLHLAGAIYTGLGIPDCIRSGVEAAQRVASSHVTTESTLSPVVA